jgi:hypothetical protein
MASPKVEIQQNIYQFDQLLSALEVLLKESQERSAELFSDENFTDQLVTILDNGDRSATIVRNIVDRIGQTAIVNGVLRQVKPEIERAIDSYINSQLDEISIEDRIERLLLNRANGVVAPSNSLENKPMEELGYDNVEEIAERMRRLAGDRAWI